MRAFLVIFACLAIAKCEASLIGHENAPTAGSLPSYQLLSGAPQLLDIQHSDIQQSDIQQSDIQLSDIQQSAIQQTDIQQSDIPLSDIQQLGIKQYADDQQYNEQYSQVYQLPISQYNQQDSQQYQLPIQQYTQQYQPYDQQYVGQYSQQQPAQVHKHVYFHAPPEELEEPARPRVLSPVAPPQKHYKIIFVKAPSAPTPAPVIVQPQTEEKTIIYVLSKKTDEQETPVLPTPAATEPAKPEVYYIKYKTEKELSDAVSTGSQLGNFEQLDGNIGISNIDTSNIEISNIGTPSSTTTTLESGQLNIGADLDSTPRDSEFIRIGGRPAAQYGTPEIH